MILVKIINQIIPRLLKERVTLDFFQIKTNLAGVKNYPIFISIIIEVMLYEAKSKKLSNISLSFSPLVFSQDYIGFVMKKAFQNKILPIMPLNGVDHTLFDDAKEIGLEKQIPKLNKIISMKLYEKPQISYKDVKLTLKTKRSVGVIIGPNNVHDILDSLLEKH